MGMMDCLSRHPWDAIWQLPPARVHVSNFGLEIRVDSIRPNPSVRTGQFVLALYQTVLAMATKKPGFFSASTLIKMDGVITGLINIQQSRHLFPGLANVTEWVTDLTKVNSTTAPHEIVDPDDNNFHLSYQPGSQNIPVQDIMFAALDAMVTIAKFDQESPCEYVHGISVSGNAVFFLGGFSDRSIACKWMLRALLLIAGNIVVAEKLFVNEEFQLSYDGTQIGQGYLMRISVGESNGSHGSREASTFPSHSNYSTESHVNTS